MSYTIAFGNSISLNQSSNQSLKKSNHITYNAYDVAKEFCNLFYQGMTNKGCGGVSHLFDQNAYCVYDSQEHIGFYNVMTAMASEGISKTVYDNLNCTVLPVNNEQISLQITGNVQGITFWNQSTMIYKFVDTFVITTNGDYHFIVTSYSNKLL